MLLPYVHSFSFEFYRPFPCFHETQAIQKLFEKLLETNKTCKYFTSKGHYSTPVLTNANIKKRSVEASVPLKLRYAVLHIFKA